MFTHQNAVRAFFKWEVHGKSPKQVLVIETDLELDSQKDGFDNSKLDDLVDAAVAAMEEYNTVIDRVDVLPVEKS